MAKEKEYPVTEAPKMAPVHPGEVLREDVLPALGLNVIEAAKELRVSRQTLHRILAGKMAVSPEMAVRLGKFCGNGSGLWLRLQAAYDLWHAEKRLRGEVRRIPTRRAA
jgi:addiction module HigA family antidote